MATLGPLVAWQPSSPTARTQPCCVQGWKTGVRAEGMLFPGMGLLGPTEGGLPGFALCRTSGIGPARHLQLQ